MVVKIVFPSGPKVTGRTGKNSHLAAVAGALLTMAAIALISLGVWRLTADLEWTGEFFIQAGLWSHWQVWLAVGTATAALAFRMWKYAHGGEKAPSKSPGTTAAPATTLLSTTETATTPEPAAVTARGKLASR